MSEKPAKIPSGATEKEAKYARDKHEWENAKGRSKNINQSTAKEALGISPSNYHKIRYEDEGLDYLDNLFQEHKGTKTWEQVKKHFGKYWEDLGISLEEAKKIWIGGNKSQPAKIFSRMEQAERFNEEQPVYYDRSGIWWIWDNEKKFWKITDEVDILNMVRDSTGRDIISSKNRQEILNALKQEGRKNKPLDADPKLIQFANGLVHIDHPDVLIAPTPAYFITNPLPFKIGDSSDTPTIDKIFKEWVGDAYVLTLYEIIAYCIYAEYNIKRIFCFPGPGNNGKGCFFNLIAKFMGLNNIVTTELDLLSSNRFEVSKLFKKSVAMISETDEDSIKKSLWIKKLSGNDYIDFEKKYAKDTIRAKNYAKILISTNLLPPSPDKSEGWYDRWLIIDFIGRFDGTIDILSTIPEKEYENLGRKCIEILGGLLKKRKFHNEGDLENRRKRYEERSDPLGQFLEEFVEEDFSSYIWKTEFEKRLNEWCRENNHKHVAGVSIGKKMKARGIEQSKKTMEWLTHGSTKRCMVWEGIKWK